MQVIQQYSQPPVDPSVQVQREAIQVERERVQSDEKTKIASLQERRQEAMMKRQHDMNRQDREDQRKSAMHQATLMKEGMIQQGEDRRTSAEIDKDLQVNAEDNLTSLTIAHAKEATARETAARQSQQHTQQGET